MLGIKDETGLSSKVDAAAGGARKAESKGGGSGKAWGSKEKKCGGGGSPFFAEKKLRDPKAADPQAARSGQAAANRAAADLASAIRFAAPPAEAHHLPKRFSAPQSGDFTPGDLVEVKGLVGAAQHNGKRGAVLHYNVAKGRYVSNHNDPP